MKKLLSAAVVIILTVFFCCDTAVAASESYDLIEKGNQIINSSECRTSPEMQETDAATSVLSEEGRINKKEDTINKEKDALMPVVSTIIMVGTLVLFYDMSVSKKETRTRDKKNLSRYGKIWIKCYLPMVIIVTLFGKKILERRESLIWLLYTIPFFTAYILCKRLDRKEMSSEDSDNQDQ